MPEYERCQECHTRTMVVFKCGTCHKKSLCEDCFWDHVEMHGGGPRVEEEEGS